MAGFIKIYRDVLDSVLFTKPVLLQMWLLLNKLARFVKTEQDGIEILPGQVLTSTPELAQRCNLSERRVRYVLDCLETMNLITRENIRNRYTRITLTNPDELRDVKPQPTEAKEDATTQPIKEQKACFGMFGNVYLTNEEKQQLQKRTPVADSYIERLSAYKRRTDKRYEDDFAVLLEWISKDEISKAEKQTVEVPRPMHERAPMTDFVRVSGGYTEFDTSPPSYDLEKADMLARTTVPKLRKRNQRNT